MAASISPIFRVSKVRANDVGEQNGANARIAVVRSGAAKHDCADIIYFAAPKEQIGNIGLNLDNFIRRLAVHASPVMDLSRSFRRWARGERQKTFPAFSLTQYL